MLSFVTNDNVVLKYTDTGNGDPRKWNKDPLILVCCRIFAIAFYQRKHALYLCTRAA